MQTSTYQKRSRKNKVVLWIILALLILAAGGAAAYYYAKSQNKDAVDVRPVNTVDYNPPSEQEQKETEEFKQQQQQNAGDTQTNATGNITPIISYIGQYDASIEASAYVPNLVEKGGTCTLTLIQGASKVVKTTTAANDAQTTRCNLFMFPAKELKVGKWSATVSYSSSTSAGTSARTEFEVK